MMVKKMSASWSGENIVFKSHNSFTVLGYSIYVCDDA